MNRLQELGAGLVRIKEQAIPTAPPNHPQKHKPEASGFGFERRSKLRSDVGSVDKKDTIIKKDWWPNIAAAKVLIISMEYRRFKTYDSSRLNITS